MQDRNAPAYLLADIAESTTVHYGGGKGLYKARHHYTVTHIFGEHWILPDGFLMSSAGGLRRIGPSLYVGLERVPNPGRLSGSRIFLRCEHRELDLSSPTDSDVTEESPDDATCMVVYRALQVPKELGDDSTFFAQRVEATIAPFAGLATFLHDVISGSQSARALTNVRKLPRST